MKLLIHLVFAALLFSISSYSSAQMTFEMIIGDSITTDIGHSVQQTNDGGYIIVGASYIYELWSYVYLIKTNVYGDTIWTKALGRNDFNGGSSVQQTSDGGYVIAGWTSVYGGYQDVYLIKTDAKGDTIWTKTFGGSSYDWGSSVQQTSDGGFVIAGTTNSFGAGNTDVYLIKTDAKGNTIWTKTFGGSNWESGNSVQQTSDGGYVIAGGTHSFGAGYSDVYLIKTDADGDTIWTKTFGGSSYDSGNSVQQTNDGGYVIAGSTETDVYLIKTDTNGSTIWTKTIRNGTDNSGGYCVQQTTDGGYVIAGETRPPDPSWLSSVYIIRTNTDGDTLWTRTFAEGTGLSVQQSNDGGYVIAGYVYAFNTPGQYNVYLIKTNADGVVSVIAENRVPLNFTLSQNYPNPFNPSTVISYQLPVSGSVSLKVYDLLGRKVATLVDEYKPAGSYEVEFDASELSSGVYIYKLTADNYTAAKKLMLLK